MAIDRISKAANIDDLADSVLSEVDDFMVSVKEMQRRKVASNVELVIQALKKIDNDIREKYDGVTTVIEKRVSTIKDGKDGQNGANGRDGKDGRPGRDGAVGPRGVDGLNGSNGRDGEDGVSVTDARIDFDGSLVISLSSGREINVGEVVAPDLADKIKVITNGGGTSQGVLDTLTSLQNQINVLVNLGAVNYVGTWNASTNTPTIVASTGDKGDYYVVSVAGSSSIDGQTLWGVGDWIIFNGAVWQRVDGGSTGNFTTLNASGVVTFDNLTASQAVFTNGSDQLVSNAITGTGNVVMSTSPTLVTPALGTPASGVVTNLTGTASININGTVGATTASTGAFTTLTTSSTVTHNGGTANGVAYLNASKVLTTGSALTFDGTTLGSTALNITGNTTLGDATTDTVTVNGYMGVGGAGQAGVGLTVTSSAVTGSSQYGVYSTITSSATSNTGSFLSLPKTAASAFTADSVHGFYALNATLGAGSTITNQYGVRIADLTSGTNNYGITSQVSSGTNKWNIYVSGTAQNYFAGNVGIGTSSPTQKLTIADGNILLTSSTSTDQYLDINTTATSSYSYVKGTARNSSATARGWRVGYSPVTDTVNLTSATGIDSAAAIRLDYSGNLGLGVTPSAWSSSSSIKVIQNPAGAFWNFSNNNVYVGQNYYWDGTNRIYLNTAAATEYNQGSGQHRFYTAASGTAGNAITFTQAMTLDASGNLGIGTSSPTAKLDIQQTQAASTALTGFTTSVTNSSANISTAFRVDLTPSATPIVNLVARAGGGATATSMGFVYRNATGNEVESMRIDSSGNVQVSTGSVVVWAPAPASISTTATLTNANIQGQIINTTGTSYTVTMPLGTTMETLVPWAATNLGYEFTVINTASGTITMAVNTGVTSLGDLTIATGASAQFQIRRTAANTFVLYRMN